MSLFARQPGFCAACGKKDEYDINMHSPVLCSPECWEEFNWRYALCVMGKPYYPPPGVRHPFDCVCEKCCAHANIGEHQ